MKISYKKLQEYIKEPLPEVSKLAEMVTMHAFEIEEIEKHGDDTVLDFKVLPDRAGYCLSHMHIAREVAALLKLTFSPVAIDIQAHDSSEKNTSGKAVSIVIEENAKSHCSLYIGRIIDGIKNGPTPDQYKTFLEAIGQRSINTVVDLSNYVMFDLGQPMHAFDIDKVKGGITVRFARAGEKIELLDGRIVELDPTILVIADDEAPLALAGIKGGKKAEVTSETKGILLESANFNSTYVRKMSQKLNIKNDSTKRFENGVTLERAALALNSYSAHIVRLFNDVTLGPIIKVGDDTVSPREISFSPAYICERIGASIETSEMMDILKRLDFNPQLKQIGESGTELNSELITITVPVYRGDIAITEDIVDEIGRLHGYDDMKGVVPTPLHSRNILPLFDMSNRIRFALARLGFSEVYTYSLREKGDIELANPLNSERSHMRNTIGEFFPKLLEQNARYMDLLNLGLVQIFEIGKTFKDKREHLSLAIGVTAKEGKQKLATINQVLDDAVKAVADIFNIENEPLLATQNLANQKQFTAQIAEGVLEVDLEALLSHMSHTPTKASVSEIDAATESFDLISAMRYTPEHLRNLKYKKFSLYPYIVRDIAVFIPGAKGKAEELRTLIQSIADELEEKILTNLYQFDEFEKKNKETGEVEKTSYAFRMIYQSYERTLTDAEVEGVMQNIVAKIKEQNDWEVR